MSPELASTISVVAAAIISGGFVWNAQKDGNKVSKMNTVLEAYDGIVKNLQNEVERMKSDLDALRQIQIECEERNERLASEVDELRKYVQNQHPQEAQPTTERKKPGPKPGSKRAAKPAPKKG